MAHTVICLKVSPSAILLLVNLAEKRCKQVISECSDVNHTDSCVSTRSFFVTYIPSLTYNDATDDTGFDLMFPTVRRGTSRENLGGVPPGRDHVP